MRHILSAAAFLFAFASSAPRASEGWAYPGGDAGGERYSSAAEITRENVGELIPVWTYRTGHMAVPEKVRKRMKFEVTPILVEDKLVLCTPFNEIIALDPESGKELWRHDPHVDMDQRPANHFNCRGVAYWRDGDAPANAKCAARVYTGTNDHRLVAVDLEDGAPCEGFGEDGVVAIDPEAKLVWPGEFQITSAPVIARGAVIVGSAISDNVSVEAPRGTVRAFDVRTGAPLWSFDPIPRDAESAAAQGWNGAEPPVEGHANVWAPMSVDEARGLVFLPTSSPSPDFFGGLRPGDNAHANSIVALDAESGALRWAFQTVHHDVWDYDVPNQPMLATITKDGRKRDVVIQATKTGLVFTLDRDTGEPVFPVEERPVPQGGVAGETLSPTQPFPVAPAPLSQSDISADDAFGLTPFDRASCAKAISAARHEGIFTPPSLEGTIVFPFTGGGANWGGGAYDPSANRFYINTTSAMHLITLVPRAETDDDWHDAAHGEQAPMRGAPYAMRRQMMVGPLGLPCNPPPWGILHAIDMDSGEETWNSVLGTTEDFAPLGLTLHTGMPGLGGPLATGGGLVFIAATMDSYLRAFDGASGDLLWLSRLPASGQAGPMSYVYKGRQYVVIAAGGHSEAGTRQGDYVVAYALPRAGDRKPSLVSRLLDRPGRRFILNMSLIGLALVGAGLLLARFVFRRR
ncbi:MAG: pyrroloquinoline quinone-dependent dehydrogenase [Parvularculaceae bacterium]|nr:pyrroloquinoline quinone-dependent dehydrogenase [Caulobacterales bacterium]